MHIDARAKDEEGNIIFEGKLNQREVSFLMEYAINDLLMAGVQFHLQEPDNEEGADGSAEPAMRLKFPNAH